MCAQGQNRSSHRAPRADSGTGEGASWGRAQLRARGGAAAPRAPAPRLSHVSSPRARAVAPEPAPPERLRAPGVSLRPPQHNRPGNGGPPSPRLAGGPRALLASGGAVSAAHFYLRSDFDAKNRAGARASRPPRPAPPWEAGRVPGRVSHVTGCVCVCVPVCVSGTGAPVPCAPPSPGCPGLDSTQGTWPAVTAPGRPLTGAPAGARVGSSTLPQGPPPSAPTARSWPRPAAGGAGVGSAPLCWHGWGRGSALPTRTLGRTMGLPTKLRAKRACGNPCSDCF